MASKQVRILDEGHGEYLPVDPDSFREWVGRKERRLVSKLTSVEEAVRQYVADGDYVVWECNYLQRGPSALLREVIRQRKRRLWAGGRHGGAADCVAQGRRISGMHEEAARNRQQFQGYSHTCKPGPPAPLAR